MDLFYPLSGEPPVECQLMQKEAHLEVVLLRCLTALHARAALVAADTGARFVCSCSIRRRGLLRSWCCRMAHPAQIASMFVVVLLLLCLHGVAHSSHFSHCAPYVLAHSTETAAYIVLPDVAGKEGLDDTMDELFGKDDSFDLMVGGDELTNRLVELQLPRFEVSYGIKSLAETLRTLGMGAVFQRGAEFGRMAPGAFIEDVLHKAVMKTDESGTVAAAVTAVCTTKGICRRPPPVPVKVKVDRPFLFVVYDKPQNIIQFVAKVETVSPVSAAEASALASTPTLPSALGDKRERGD